MVTGLVRLSYANVWEPKAANENAQPKYSVSIIIPKSDEETLKKINDAIDAAIEEGIGKFGGKKPNKAAIKLPLRDGDVEREDDESYLSMTLSTLGKSCCEGFPVKNWLKDMALR